MDPGPFARLLALARVRDGERLRECGPGRCPSRAGHHATQAPRSGPIRGRRLSRDTDANRRHPSGVHVAGDIRGDMDVPLSNRRRVAVSGHESAALAAVYGMAALILRAVAPNTALAQAISVPDRVDFLLRSPGRAMSEYWQWFVDTGKSLGAFQFVWLLVLPAFVRRNETALSRAALLLAVGLACFAAHVCFGPARMDPAGSAP